MVSECPPPPPLTPMHSSPLESDGGEGRGGGRLSGCFWRSRPILDAPSPCSHHYCSRSQDIQLFCREFGSAAHQPAASRSIPVTPCTPSKQFPEMHYLLADCSSLEYGFGKNRNRRECRPVLSQPARPGQTCRCCKRGRYRVDELHRHSPLSEAADAML